MNPRQTEIFILFLTTFCIASLMWMTWEVWRISTFVIPSDDVWGRMDGTGYMRQHYLLEAMHGTGGVQVLAAEAATAALLLFLLYRRLFRAGKIPPL